MQGQPNGMPSFGGQISDEQPWKIVAYIKSLAGKAGSEGSTADEVEGGSGEGQGGDEP